MLAVMSVQDWVERLAATPPEALRDTSPGGRGWLLNYLDPDNGWDVRRRLRVMLLAFPDAEVALDATWVGGWRAPDPGTVLFHAQRTAQHNTTAHAPLIVLPEGTTDTEFLRAALAVLYPHLTDLVRFLDYERKPEGGASAILRAVRAFDAAGIANRVVAVLDSDAAAADALRAYGRISLSDRIRLIQYPPLGLARQYPTLGPPTVRSHAVAIEQADVNGLAASIELYLGRDVLTSCLHSLIDKMLSMRRRAGSRCRRAGTGCACRSGGFRSRGRQRSRSWVCGPCGGCGLRPGWAR